jgi:hypothetical protein
MLRVPRNLRAGIFFVRVVLSRCIWFAKVGKASVTHSQLCWRPTYQHNQLKTMKLSTTLTSKHVLLINGSWWQGCGAMNSWAQNYTDGLSTLDLSPTALLSPQTDPHSGYACRLRCWELFLIAFWWPTGFCRGND